MLRLDELEPLTSATCMEDLWSAHCQAMAGYGFDRLLYGYTRFRTETSLGDPADYLILSNHSPAYLQGFIDSGIYFNAPMLKWALENDGPRSWRHIAEMAERGELTEEELAVLDFNQAMHVTAGYSISFRSPSPRSKGAISLAARPGLSQAEVDQIWAENGRRITALNNITHLKILSLPNTSNRRGLTARQREALQWVGDGKTTQDIAVLMGLTPATVEKHLRLARSALNVETTAQAVLKAAVLNQMFVAKA